MPDPVESEIVCRACGATNSVTAITCAACGANLNAASVEPDVADQPAEATQFVDDDPALRTVDPEHRVELEHYEIDHGAEAEIACGLLRANGIPCELSSGLLPGLPSEVILWVNAQDAATARALLDDSESVAPQKDIDAA